MEFWLFNIPSIHDIGEIARRTEAQGFDGMTLTDSQNLTPDTYVSLTLAAQATTRLKLGPGVTNPVTRHPAVAAAAIAALDEVSGGRAVMGIGRGDSSLFNIGHEPASPAAFEAYVRDLQSYLRGETIDQNGYPSRIRWIDPDRGAKVPVDVAATGPKVIAIGARHAERVSFSVGADPERIRWALDRLDQALPEGVARPSPGVYLNVCVDDDVARAADQVRAGVGIFAHFTGMKGATQERVPAEDAGTYRALGQGYDRLRHGQPDASHARDLPLDFIRRFAVIGSAEECLARLSEIAATGIERIVVIGPRLDLYGTRAEAANERFAKEVMPRLRR